MGALLRIGHLCSQSPEPLCGEAGWSTTCSKGEPGAADHTNPPPKPCNCVLRPPDGRSLDLGILEFARHRNLVFGKPRVAALGKITSLRVADKDGAAACLRLSNVGYDTIGELAFIKEITDDDDVFAAWQFRNQIGTCDFQ